jgi:two-component system nitrate/nitrite response regulator NarL
MPKKKSKTSAKKSTKTAKKSAKKSVAKKPSVKKSATKKSSPKLKAVAAASRPSPVRSTGTGAAILSAAAPHLQNNAVRVLIADDDPLVRAAIGVMLPAPRFKVIAEAVNGDEAARKARELKPDVLLLDLAMPGKAGMEALRDLGNSVPGMKTAVLTVAIAKRQIVEALQLGARGIVLKEGARDVLANCIEAMLKGSYWVDRQPVSDVHKVIKDLLASPELNRPSKRDLLNPKEMQIVTFIVEGRTNKDIAGTLNTSEQVIKNHLGKIFDKLGVFNRLELALYALDNQMVERSY